MAVGSSTTKPRSATTRDSSSCDARPIGRSVSDAASVRAAREVHDAHGGVEVDGAGIHIVIVCVVASGQYTWS